MRTERLMPPQENTVRSRWEETPGNIAIATLRTHRFSIWTESRLRCFSYMAPTTNGSIRLFPTKYLSACGGWGKRSVMRNIQVRVTRRTSGTQTTSLTSATASLTGSLGTSVTPRLDPRKTRKNSEAQSEECAPLQRNYSSASYAAKMVGSLSDSRLTGLFFCEFWIA